MSFLNPVRAVVEKIVTTRAQPPSRAQRINYLEPAGDPGIFGPASVAWRVLSNPASVFVGGITAVLLELAEPSVRSGVWDHTDFRRDPVGRMRRTGLAAMVITYGVRAMPTRRCRGYGACTKVLAALRLMVRRIERTIQSF
jgi:uncharacterized protein (DUF2236 family)